MDEADESVERTIHKLRKLKGFCPMTPAEADAAYEAAPADALSDDEIESLVEFAITGQKSREKAVSESEKVKRLFAQIRRLKATLAKRVATIRKMQELPEVKKAAATRLRAKRLASTTHHPRMPR